VASRLLLRFLYSDNRVYLRFLNISQNRLTTHNIK